MAPQASAVAVTAATTAVLASAISSTILPPTPTLADGATSLWDAPPPQPPYPPVKVLAPILALATLVIGLLVGLLLYCYCALRRRGNRSVKTTQIPPSFSNNGGNPAMASREATSLIVRDQSRTPQGHAEHRTSIASGDGTEDDHAWDHADDVRTPLLACPSPHAIASPALSARSAALWLSATASVSSSTLSRVSSRPPGLFGDDLACAPSPPFDYEVALLFDERTGSES